MFPMHFNVENIKTVSYVEGRKLCIEFTDDEQQVALLNVYAPTKDKIQQHAEFINSLRNELEMFSDKLIIGGDFNLYLNSDLDKDQTNLPICKASVELKNILNDFDYIDIWRILMQPPKGIHGAGKGPWSNLDWTIGLFLKKCHTTLNHAL